MNARPHSPRLLAALLVLCAVAAFLPAIWSGYIWDDDSLLTANPLVQTPRGLVQIWEGKNSRDYTPLTISAFWLEWRLWGSTAVGYHLVNLLLHALAAVLLWRVLAALRIPGAWLGALFFAIHPINASSAVWVAELKNTLSSVFFLGSILAFLTAYIRRDGRWLVASVALFLFAGLSKGAVVTLPVVLAGCVFGMYGKFTRRDLLRLLPFALIALAVALLTIRYQARAENYGLLPDTMPFRIARAGSAVLWYLREIFFPAGLSPFAPQWEMNLRSPLAYLPVLAVGAFLALFIWKRRTWGRPLLFAYGCFLWMLLPVLGFVRMALQQETPAADWWQYMAAPAIFASVAAGFAVGMRDAVKSARLFLQITLGLVIASLFFQSWRRSATYESMETYCRAVIDENPRAWTLQNNLGVVLKQRGAYAQAIACYEQAMADNPRFIEARNNLGNAFTAEGNFTKAEAAFLEALKLSPDDPRLLSGLAEAYFRDSKINDAFSTQARAIQADRFNPRLYTQFGNMLVANRQFPQAATCYNNALLLDPRDNETRVDLIRALLAEGRREEAAVQCRQALDIARKSRDDKLAQVIAPLLDQATQP